ncbi:kinase-like protein [Cylindrobasidium torrendii FP15055 ss-10]|uniref:Kinase-like protein n=1 Tax=Cylindrobasidium torrendii FP15055 ss-10 TaxID=1314674 RepID=A0A0D7B633_9AGAR|nr:kinase-like protein [Cylindrobasidium torrendii FP15055 ss-10]
MSTGACLPSDDFFNYTSGRWVYNEPLRQRERRLVFDVDGLLRLAAESVNQRPSDVVSISKLAEGGFNRVFLITLGDNQRIIARIPYPLTVPKYYAVASEAATIEYMRLAGIPVPQIYGYSADTDNAAGTPYILMEFVKGSKLSDVWPSLDEQEIVSIVREITQMESRMMALSFPAGGSLYFTQDVKNGSGIPLDDARFCVGPESRMSLWYGRRGHLDAYRGPYHSVETALAAGAHKELAYLSRFAEPVMPIRRERRPSYQYQKQLPSAHAELLEKYLRLAPSLPPKDPALGRFRIRHPDLNYNNIMLSKSPSSGRHEVVSLIDWQHTSILPMFLLAGIPHSFQNHSDPISQAMTPPTLHENFDTFNDADKDRAMYSYLRQLVHYQYVTSTAQCNPSHYAAFSDPLHTIRGRLFQQAGAPWEGESLDLKDALIKARDRWDELTGSTNQSCPVAFDAEDRDEMALLNKKIAQAEMGFSFMQNMAGVAEEGWVPNEDYEHAMRFLSGKKEEAFKYAQSDEEREEITEQWPWDDMDEEMYM